jgi:hypothetical protein
MKRLFIALVIGLSWARADSLDAPEALAPGIVYTQKLALTPPAEIFGIVYDLRELDPPPELPALAAHLSQPSAPLSVVLLNANTDPTVIDAFTNRSHRVIVLSPIGSRTAPDVLVPVTAEEIATALDAIRSGADLASLASPEIAKSRFDEASLVRRHNGTEEPVPTRSADSAPSTVQADDETAGDETSPTPPDLMLQRAVQILQGLRALGRS